MAGIRERLGRWHDDNGDIIYVIAMVLFVGLIVFGAVMADRGVDHSPPPDVGPEYEPAEQVDPAPCNWAGC